PTIEIREPQNDPLPNGNRDRGLCPKAKFNESCYSKPTLMLDLKPATFEEFESEAARGNVVPVVRKMLADSQTPVGAFLRLAGDAPYAFLLESIEGGERVARYSFLGANPWLIARGRGAQTTVETNGKSEV